MRLKTYAAETANEALRLIREELGESAVIVSTETDKQGGRTVITAAYEEGGEPDHPATAEPGEVATDKDASAILEDLSDASATLRQMLSRHGVPPHLGARIVTAAALDRDRDMTSALDEGLRVIYRFSAFGTAPSGAPLMLVGPPGVGKTVTVAKMAARAVMARAMPTVVTTDTVRAGAIGQLEAFTKILGLDLKTTRTIGDLQQAVENAAPGPILIDTAGVNPFDESALDIVATSAQAIGAEPILVLAAGGDAVEASEIAAAFTRVGCRRLLATRIDLTRRLGSLLAAADSGRLAFSDVSITPDIADGLMPIESRRLAELLCDNRSNPARPS
ncbi:MAG: hypothetical protein RIC16_03680 [Rhodospirillales bacterium]